MQGLMQSQHWRYIHHITVQEVLLTHIRSTQTKCEAQHPCRPPKNEPFIEEWLQQTQSPSDNVGWCITTHGWKTILLEIGLFTSVPLLEDGRWTVSPILAFNFGSRTVAFLRWAQGLNRFLSAFNSTVREYLDPLVKADKCGQYVDDIGIAANTDEELVNNIEEVFTKIRQAGLKLSMEKCAFGHTEIEFLGRSITTKGIATIKEKTDKILRNIKSPTSVKSLERYIGFVQFYRRYIPRIAEKLVPLNKLLEKDVINELT